MNNPSVTLTTLAEAGVVGAGGAGFPTHVKLAGRADYVLLNAAECEPLLHKDKEILRYFTDDVIQGLAVAISLCGAQEAIIGVKEKYHEVIDLLRQKIPTNMRVAPLRDAYPAGDEFILVYETLGRVIPPGGIPLNVGAVVMNVETAMNAAPQRARPGRREVSLGGRRGGRADFATGSRRSHARTMRRRGGRSDRRESAIHCGRGDDGIPRRKPSGSRH